MNRLTNKYLLVLMALSLSAHASSQGHSPFPDDIEREITEGKILAAMADQQNDRDLRQTVDEKQLKAIKLINVVGTYANDRFSSDIDKEEADHAYSGFIARFQGIREDRVDLERKEIIADNKTLQNYSDRLDRLIVDIEKFLK